MLRSRSGRRRNGLSAGVAAAQHEMIAAAGAGVAAVQHEFFGAQARLARVFVKRGGVGDQFLPVARPDARSLRSRRGRA